MVLLAKDIMDREVLVLDEATDVLTAARTMVERRKGYAILVRQPRREPVGIVTEWDLLEKVLAPGRSPQEVRLRDIASSPLQQCAPETPTDEVVSRMAERGVRRIVVRRGDEILGVITSRSVLANFRKYVDRVSAEIAGFRGPTG